MPARRGRRPADFALPIFMFAILTKQFRFEAAHQLPNHRGKCARLHGHSYMLEVSLRGPVKAERGESDDGMVVDLDVIKEVVQAAVISRVDHFNLNEIIDGPTTAERIAHWIWDRLEEADPAFAAMLYRIRLWETATGYVEIGPPERDAAPGAR
jgi:6-pyruvoyltetrahydropterin/6-carboxytetrahydropterin synthase